MKPYLPFVAAPKRGVSLSSMGLMALSAGLRSVYYAREPLHGADFWMQVLLPIVSAAAYILLFLLFGRKTLAPLCLPVAGGVAFFIYKAFSFPSALHTVLCCLLYFAVLVLFCLTLCGVIRTKLLLLPLTGLPLLTHLIMDICEYAAAPNGLFPWLPEISVLCIMGALLCLVLAMRRPEGSAMPKNPAKISCKAK